MALKNLKKYLWQHLLSSLWSMPLLVLSELLSEWKGKGWLTDIIIFKDERRFSITHSTHKDKKSRQGSTTPYLPTTTQNKKYFYKVTLFGLHAGRDPCLAGLQKREGIAFLPFFTANLRNVHIIFKSVLWNSHIKNYNRSLKPLIAGCAEDMGGI